MTRIFQRPIVVIAISLMLAILSPVHGSETETEVSFQTVPIGADVLIDGEIIGRTPLVVNLAPGIYDVEYRLPGFKTWHSPEATIYGTSTSVIVTLTGMDLRQLPSEPSLVRWHQSENQIYFIPFEGEEGINNLPILMDLDNDNIYVNPPPPHLVEDMSIRQQLGLGEFTGNSRTNAFYSPSMTYIAYSNPESPTVNIVKADTLETVIDSTVNIATIYDIVWSPEEKYAWIDRKEEGGSGFIGLSGEPQAYFLSHFQAENGDLYHINRVISAPSDSGQVLAFVRPAEQSGLSNLWLVDIKTQTGTTLPFTRVFDAAFMKDGTQIVVVHESGISLVAVDDFSQIELVSDVVSSRWGVQIVDLSPTLDYAIVYTRTESWPRVWLYKMPELH